MIIKINKNMEYNNGSDGHIVFYFAILIIFAFYILTINITMGKTTSIGFINESVSSADLRKGNLLFLINGKRSTFETQIQITCAQIQRIDESSDNEEFFKPILLSREWFFYLGFDQKLFKDHNSTPTFKTIYQLGQKIIVDNGGGDYIFCKIHDSLFLHPYSRNIKYVHQLQNLYFELKGESLKVPTKTLNEI
jgi:hypothetical protein